MADNKQKVTVEKNGVTREFGAVQWKMLAGKTGTYDGWTEVDPKNPTAAKKIPVPEELKAKRNATLPEEEKAARKVMEDDVNGNTEDAGNKDSAANETETAEAPESVPTELKKAPTKIAPKASAVKSGAKNKGGKKQ